MSGLRQKIESQAKINDRRFGKGIVCKLIDDEDVVYLLNYSNLIPPGTRLFATSEDKLIACDPSRGLYFAIPLSVLDKYQSELEQYRASERKSSNNILGFLKQNMAMIRIPNVKCPKGNPVVDPNLFDILIETVDVSQSLDGIFVPTKIFDYNRTFEIGQ